MDSNQKKMGVREHPLYFFLRGGQGGIPLRTDLCKRSSELDLAEIFVPTGLLTTWGNCGIVMITKQGLNARKEMIDMAYCIMNVDKQKRSAIYGLQAEANRQPEDDREFDASDIDSSRTSDNIFLRRCDSWNREITQQIKAAGVRERKDSIVGITGVYTASAEWFDTHPREEWMQYFEDCLRYHDRTYGRCINAVVHLDEDVPHMQCISVPLLQNETGWHLSAKTIMGGRADYQRRQDEFFKEVGEPHGMDRGIRRDAAEVKRHTTKREWQLATQEVELQQLQQRTAAAERQLAEVNRQLTDAERQLKSKTIAVEKLADDVQKHLEKPKKVRLLSRGETSVADSITIQRWQYDAALDAAKSLKALIEEAATADYHTTLCKELAEREWRQAQQARAEAENLLHNRESEIYRAAYDVLQQELRERTPLTERMQSFMKEHNIYDEFTQREREYNIEQRERMREHAKNYEIEL